MQTQRYVLRFEHEDLHPCLHLEGFLLSPLRTPQKLQIQSSAQEEAQSQGTKATISTQEMGTKLTPLLKRKAQS